MLDEISKTDEIEISTPKRLKPSLPTSSLTDNSLHQSSPTFQDLANNALLQKSMCVIISLVYCLV